MKTKWFVALLAVAGIVAGLIFAYLEMSKERQREKESEKPVTAKSRVTAGTNDEAILTLNRETQQRISLKVERVMPATMTPELKAYGRVLDPAPLAALSLELVSAQVTLAASEKEFARLKLLNEQKSASDRAYETADVTARRDRINVEATRTRLVSTWGTAVADRSDLSELAYLLTSRESALVRVELPAGEKLATNPEGARIFAASDEARSVPAELLGRAPAVDPQTQGQGFVLLLRTNSLGLAPGAAVSGYLRDAGALVAGFAVPDSAVVRQAGHGWVYVQTSDETFTRRQITLDHRTEDGWFVKSGLAANELIVVNGAQTLLSEEQKYQIRLLD